MRQYVVNMIRNQYARNKLKAMKCTYTLGETSGLQLGMVTASSRGFQSALLSGVSYLVAAKAGESVLLIDVVYEG